MAATFWIGVISIAAFVVIVAVKPGRSLFQWAVDVRTRGRPVP